MRSSVVFDRTFIWTSFYNTSLPLSAVRKKAGLQHFLIGFLLCFFYTVYALTAQTEPWLVSKLSRVMCGLLFQQHELLVGSMLPSNTLAAPLIDRQACEDVCVASALSADACRTLLWNTVITTDGNESSKSIRGKGWRHSVWLRKTVCALLCNWRLSNWNCLLRASQIGTVILSMLYFRNDYWRQNPQASTDNGRRRFIMLVFYCRRYL